MFEKFDAAARRALVMAHTVSRNHKHDEITVHDLAIAILSDDAFDTVYETLHASRNECVKRVSEAMPTDVTTYEGDDPDTTPFSADTRRALEETLRFAVEMASPTITSLHLMVGVMRAAEFDLPFGCDDLIAVINSVEYDITAYVILCSPEYLARRIMMFWPDDLTLSDAAEQLNCSVEALRSIVAGSRVIDAVMMARIAELCDVSLHELLGNLNLTNFTKDAS